MVTQPLLARNAALFVAISLLAGFGSTAMSLVAGIWTLDLTGSPSRAALAGLFGYAPTLAGPWLGGLVDRLPRRPLLVGTNLLLAASVLLLLGVTAADRAWLLYVVSLGYGLSYVLLDAGESALLPAALPSDRLGYVNGWRSSAQEGMKLAAPGAGAGLYAWHGGAAVAVLCAVLPLVGAALYALVRPGDRPATTPPGSWSDSSAATADGKNVRSLRARCAGEGEPTGARWAGEGEPTGVGSAGEGEPTGVGSAGQGEPTGARWAGQGEPTGVGSGDGFQAGVGSGGGFRDGLAVLVSARVPRVTVGVAAVAIAMSAFSTAPQYAVVLHDMALPSTFLGVLLSGQGAGSVVGGLTVGRVISRWGAPAAAVAGAVLFAAGLLARCLPWWPAMVVGAVAGGVGLPWTLVAAVTAVQTHAPDRLLGRVSATANTVMFGPIALANPLGAVAVHLGGRPGLGIAAAVCLGAAAVASRGGGQGRKPNASRSAGSEVTHAT
ncbi:MFS transporter [Actinoplanes sp. NPDC051494]|uniref:MFS transporter n=1 Tax=Actinoplanes sp. NPDC051494 TaxID=3363907 RepID=UPI0037B6D4B6